MVNCRKYGDPDVEGEADGSDHQHHFCNGFVQVPEVDNNCSSKEKEGKLQQNGQQLHHWVQTPLVKPHEFDLALLPSVSDIPPHRGLSVIQDPPFPQHCDEGHQQCDG